MKRINIANDFSRFPGGRYEKHGKYSGEEFRERFLLPCLQAGMKVEICLDDTLGYPSSFLEEAFGGLIRSGISKKTVYGLLTFNNQNPVSDFYVRQIWKYIESA